MKSQDVSIGFHLAVGDDKWVTELWPQFDHRQTFNWIDAIFALLL